MRACRPAAGGAGIVSLFLALTSSSCAGGTARLGEESPPAKRSVLVGELLAIFPGILVHGMGHRYAGNKEKADEILTMELYSLLPAGLGGALYGIGESEDAEAVKVAGWIGIGVGAVPFIGTWIYDLVFTPSEVERANLRAAGSGE